MPSPGDRSVSIAILVVGALPALLDDPLSIGRRTGATHLPFCRIGDSTLLIWLNCLQQGFFARTGLAERRYYRTMSADSATYRGEGSADGCFALRQAPSVRRVLRAWIRLVQSRPVVPILHGHADVGNDHRPHSGIGLQHRVGGFRRPHGSGHRRAGPAWSAAQAIHASDRASLVLAATAVCRTAALSRPSIQQSR